MCWLLWANITTFIIEKKKGSKIFLQHVITPPILAYVDQHLDKSFHSFLSDVDKLCKYLIVISSIDKVKLHYKLLHAEMFNVSCAQGSFGKRGVSKMQKML